MRLIAPGKDEGFADIFEGNAYNNGLLPIELADSDWQALAEAAAQPGGAEATIDLESQTLTLDGPTAPAPRTRSTSPKPSASGSSRGLDAIAETLVHDADIRRHEHKPPPGSPRSRPSDQRTRPPAGMSASPAGGRHDRRQQRAVLVQRDRFRVPGPSRAGLAMPQAAVAEVTALFNDSAIWPRVRRRSWTLAMASARRFGLERK